MSSLFSCMHTSPSPETSPPAPAVPSQRLLSLDALRGLDMLCIIGLGSLVSALAAKNPDMVWLQTLTKQWTHCAWEGIHLFDLIFPLFLFIAGVSMAFSFRSMQAKNTSRPAMAWHLVKRALLLAGLGIIVNGPLEMPWQDWRFASVLGLIGTAGAVAGLLALWLKKTSLLAIAFSVILLVTAILQLTIGTLDRDGCVNGLLDRLILPGSLHGGNIDPEGILCIFSAVAVALGGYLTGRYLANTLHAPWRKAASMGGAGLACLLAGWALHTTFYPAIKNMWTSSFDLIAMGWSLLALTVAYFLFDVMQWRKTAYPLQVVGANALFIYMAQAFVSFHSIANHLFGGIASEFPATQWVIMACATLLIQWLLLAWMHSRRIFIKI